MSFYTIRPTKWQKLKHITRSTLLPNILLSIAAGLFITGLSIGLYSWYSNEVANHRTVRLVYEANNGIRHDTPSTTKPIPTAFAKYTVPPNFPRYIFIPKLSVRAIIKPLGLTATGQIATPSNVYDAGWYKKSSTPGQPGAMVIDGHVSSWTTNGVFYGLKTLQPGDAIQVERGDGTMLNYSVIKKRVYDYKHVDMLALLSPINADKPGLNLITCTGNIIKGTNDFSGRVVIFATQT